MALTKTKLLDNASAAGAGATIDSPYQTIIPTFYVTTANDADMVVDIEIRGNGEWHHLNSLLLSGNGAHEPYKPGAFSCDAIRANVKTHNSGNVTITAFISD